MWEASWLALVDDDEEEEALSVCKSELSWIRSSCSFDKTLELLDEDVLLLDETPVGWFQGADRAAHRTKIATRSKTRTPTMPTRGRSGRWRGLSSVARVHCLALLDDDDDEALSACRSEPSWLRSFCSVDRRLEPLDDDAP